MIAFFVHSIGVLAPMLSSFYIFAKSIQYKSTVGCKILAISWCFLWSILFGYAAVTSFIPLLIIRPLLCLTSVIFAFLISRHELKRQQGLNPGKILEITATAYLLSFGISCFLYYIALIPVFVPSMFLLSSETVVDAPLDYNQPIYLLLYFLTLIIQLILSVFIFKIKRFKNGFTFIFKKYTVVVALLFSGIILMLITGVNTLAVRENARTTEEMFTVYVFIAGTVVFGSGIFILIRRLVKNYQRMRIRQHSESQFEKMYLEVKAENERLRKLNDEIEKAKSSALHSINDKIKALREAVEKGNATLDGVENLENAWESELDKFKEKKRLQSTKVNGIDLLLDYYENQFTDDDIVFELILDGNIKYMVDNVIKQSQFETLITNHLNDAKIAVNASENTYRRITAIIRFKDDCYEFSVLDSGIPFEVDTLVRLGTERVTTHAETGGSGIGFETTFEIMREYNASLIISEQEESDIDFSKSVTIRFDGKSQYIIETYRPGDFPANERYTIIGR